jgi:hypothetical protein
MHPLAERTVREALRRGAVLDAIAHHDAIAALDASARATQDADIQDEVDDLDRPVEVGRPPRAAALRPLSLAGHLWLDEAAAQGWFSNDGLVENLAVAWVLANGREAQALAAAGLSERRARQTILRWARGIDGGLDALLTAARRVAGSGSQGQAEGTAPAAAEVSGAVPANPARSVRGLLARLTHEFGQAEDYWLYGPYARVMAAVNLLRRDAAAIAKATRGKGGQARDPEDPEVKAFRRWRKASDDFLAAVCPEAETGRQGRRGSAPIVAPGPDEQTRHAEQIEPDPAPNADDRDRRQYRDQTGHGGPETDIPPELLHRHLSPLTSRSAS